MTDLNVYSQYLLAIHFTLIGLTCLFISFSFYWMKSHFSRFIVGYEKLNGGRTEEGEISFCCI